MMMKELGAEGQEIFRVFRLKCSKGVTNMPEETIKNPRELEFSIFCIENVAAKLGVDAELVYRVFTEKSNILNDYIVPEYEVLHTQSREYIVNDLLDVMKERGIRV